MENSKLNVLIIDDDNEFLSDAREYLSKEFNITTENDSVKIYDNINCDNFPIINYNALILDYEMPSKNAENIINLMYNKNLTKKIPIIVLTAHDNVEYSDNCFQYGAWDYVIKPPHWRDIAFRLKRAIRTHKSYKEVQETLEINEKISQYFPGIYGHEIQLKQLIGDLMFLSKKKGDTYKLLRPRGSMLIGPPGTGKTLIAKKFGEAFDICKEIKIHEILNHFYGKSEKQINEIISDITVKSNKDKLLLIIFVSPQREME